MFNFLVLYIVWMLTLFQIYILCVSLVKIFSRSVGCHFVQMRVSVATQLFSFMRSHVLIVLSACVRSESLNLCRGVQGYSPTLSSIRFSVCDLTLRLLTHLELSLYGC